MIRVGIVGTNTSHAAVFAGLLNGTPNEGDDSAAAVAGAKVVGVWSSGKEGLSGAHPDAAQLADRFVIDRVVGRPEELVDAVDLALVLDDLDGGVLHPELARPFLEAGTATYIDKPMALRPSDARALFDLADRHGGPLLSCSALRFANELGRLRSDGLGRPSSLISVGPGDWYNYGIHAVEAAVTVCGPGARSVLQLHSPDKDLTTISRADGVQLVISTLRDARTPFHLTVYGSEGYAQTEVSDYAGFYANTMRAAVAMAETRQPPVDRRETLEVLEILAAGERSAATGGPVELADLREEEAR